jgi:uncharacterized membrane protein YbhN (UPF0104 family)
MKKKSLTFIKIAVSVILLCILIVFTDINKIIAEISRFNSFWLFPVFGLIIVSVGISACKWQILLRAQGVSIPWGRLFQYYTVGFFFNNFLPSSLGCDGVRIAMLQSEFGSWAGSASSVVMERVLAAMTLCLLGMMGGVFAEAASPPVLGAMALLFGASLFAVFVQLTGWVPPFLRGGEGRFAGGWKNFAGASAELRRRPAHIAACIAESLLFQITAALVTGSIMSGLGQPPIPPPDLFYAASAASVMAMIPLGVNGYGLREGAYIFLLAPYGYSPEAAFSVSALFAIFVSIYSLSGIPLLLLIKSRGRAGAA